MRDILENAILEKNPDGQHGLVRLVDVMPRLVPEGQGLEQAIVQAARVSYGQGTKTVQEDSGLIRYLMRHRHTTPFEMVETKWLHVMPITTARQWIRHRTANVNEYSARYSEVKDRFYIPPTDDVRAQILKGNKQGSEIPIAGESADWFGRRLDTSCAEAMENYKKALARGIGREQARWFLPTNVYTEWYWKIDLHNLFHFLSLRMDSHAQKEIRVFAEAIFEILKPLAPVACQAFVDYRLESVTLSRLEKEALRARDGDLVWVIDSESKGERLESYKKFRDLGFTPTMRSDDQE